MAARCAGADRLGQGGGAAHFHDDVGATPARSGQHRVAPSRLVLVVDHHIGAQCAQAFCLAGAGRGGNHARAHGLGQLQGKDRDTARAQHQHRVACLQVAIHHQGAPGGQAGGGQGGRFFVAVAGGRMGKGGCGQGHAVAGKAVDTIAGHGRKGGGHVAARKPLREKARDDGVAHGKLSHVCAHGGDHACAIGHGYAAIGRGGFAGDDQQIMEIERAGVQPHLDFARLGRCGIG